MTRTSSIAIALIVASVVAPAFGQGTTRKFDDLLRRVPNEANAMVLVDVDGLFDGSLGRRDKWRERSAERPTGVMGVSADASRLVVAAGIDLTTMEERWKVGMLATHASPPGLATLAARDGEYLEQLQAQNVSWTPRNSYLVSFPERIIGFAVPSDRQPSRGRRYRRRARATPRSVGPRDRTRPAGCSGLSACGS